MKLVPIFTDPNTFEGLYSILYDDQTVNEFERLLDLWDDIKYLKNYLVYNQKHLNTTHFGNISPDTAMTKVLEERQEIENLIYNYTESGFTESGENLQMLFRPLLNKQTNIPPHQETKAKIESRNFPRILRIYAIRIGANSFIISGGAIKLTKNMIDHPDTDNELKKIELVKSFLRKNGLETFEDLNFYYEG